MCFWFVNALGHSNVTNKKCGTRNKKLTAKFSTLEGKVVISVMAYLHSQLQIQNPILIPTPFLSPAVRVGI